MSDRDAAGASIVFTTVASADDARTLARLVVEHRLAACVQMVPIHSVYRWDGEVREDDEVLVLIKAPSASVPSIEAAVAEHHRYDVPELLHVAMDGGLPDYLRWLVDSTGDPARTEREPIGQARNR